jgi:CubicO group peptidase (beta-lactamase class C family)
LLRFPLGQGTQFTYDSDQYIDHLAYLISKVTNESSQTWATREYALPMGLNPDIFAYGGFVDPIDGNEFSPGGGQMMTCRDHLRVAQLLINKGKWADDDGGIQGQSAVPTPASAAASGVDLAASSDDVAPATRPYKQLLTEEFVEEFLQPSYPNVTQSYGFLVWYTSMSFVYPAAWHLRLKNGNESSEILKVELSILLGHKLRTAVGKLTSSCGGEQAQSGGECRRLLQPTMGWRRPNYTAVYGG